MLIVWFQSYLRNRSQKIQIGEHLSAKLISPCGVPQGSVLRPLLYLLYKNGIHLCSDKLKYSLFADDTSILYNDKNLMTIKQIVNAELNNVMIGSLQIHCRLILHTKKSIFFYFSYLSEKNAFCSTKKYFRL